MAHQLNLVRCIFGAVGTSVVQLLYNAIGAGWTTTLFTGICLAGTPLLVTVMIFAPRWRQARREKAESKKEEKDRQPAGPVDHPQGRNPGDGEGANRASIGNTDTSYPTAAQTGQEANDGLRTSKREDSGV